jgi:hypothetical protein
MNNQLNAAKSFWIYERDKELSNLDFLLNKSVCSSEIDNYQENINKTILKLSQAINSIQTIDNIIESSNSNKS